MARQGGYGERTASRIFRAIWRNPGISRIDLARLLELDKSTVTNQVAFLIDSGLVDEVDSGEASSRGGRRPIRLSVRKESGCFIGVELQLGFYESVVVDAAGEIRGSLRGEASTRADNFADTIASIVEKTKAEFGCSRSLLGVGVGTAGLVDSKKGRIRFSVPLGISRPLDFIREMSGKLDVPHSIENDANCCAWGELAFNRTEDLRNFLFALVEYRRDIESLRKYGGIGVGFGIVLSGKVHTGSHGFAGEFRSAFCAERNEQQFSLPREELVRLGQDRRVLERTIDELARNMAMLINTIDFSQVFIGGDIESLQIDLPSILREKLEENWMYPSPKDVEIRFSSLGDKAVAYGAAGMVFERLLAAHALPGFAGNPASLVP